MKTMRNLLLLAAMIVCGNAFADTETELTAKGGTASNEAVEGESYVIAGTYIAGKGSTKAGNMTSKGFKLRTGTDGARAVFTVTAPYHITRLSIEAIANYTATDPELPCIKAISVEVDGQPCTSWTGGEFPQKGSDESANLTIEGIDAAESIAIYFDNSNASGTQLNACYEVTYEAPEASEPMITVTPDTLHLIPGATYQLIAKVVPTEQFAGQTFWYAGNIEDFLDNGGQSVCETVSIDETGLLTALAPGEAQVKHTWTGNIGVLEDTCVVYVSDFNPSFYTKLAEYDFTTMGDMVLTQGESAGKIWNDANSQCNEVFWCADEGFERLAFQAVASDTGSKGWIIVDGRGLLDANAGRCAAVGGLKAGQYVEIEYTGSIFATRDMTMELKLGPDAGAPKEVINEEPGRAIFKMIEAINPETGESTGTEDLMMGFEINRGECVKRIAVYGDYDSTGISEIGKQNLTETPVYNLAGQKVAKTFRGLTIQNGKKMMVK